MGNHSTNWAEKIRTGDRQAFKQAFSHFYTGLCRYTTRFTGSPHLAEDIVQEVFISLWKNREKLIITTSLKSYLYKACYHRFIDHTRKNKNVDQNLEKYRYHKLMAIEKEDSSTKKEDLIRLRQAIDQLPPKCKKIFIMSKFEGLRYADIAKNLGISQKTVENQISIAFAKLRELTQDTD